VSVEIWLLKQEIAVQKPFKPKLPLHLPTRLEIRMLSEKEIEFLRTPESFNSNYRYFLKHQIKNKVQALQNELTLLSNAGFLNNLSESSKSLREFNKTPKTEISSNQASFDKIKWTGGDLNPRPLECKSSVHTS
jgi:hypothetical protein